MTARWLKGWRCDFLLSAVGHALAFSGLMWLGWQPGPVLLGVAFQTVALACLFIWRLARGAPGKVSAFAKPVVLPALIGALSVGILAGRLAAAAQDPLLFWTSTAASAMLLFLPAVSRMRLEVRRHVYLELSWRDLVGLLLRTLLAFGLAVWGRTGIEWPQPPLPDAATLTLIALVAVMAGFACDAIQTIGRGPPMDFLEGKAAATES